MVFEANAKPKGKEFEKQKDYVEVDVSEAVPFQAVRNEEIMCKLKSCRREDHKAVIPQGRTARRG